MPRDRIDASLSASPLEGREFADLMAACVEVGSSRGIAVGVSGGADSMALVLLADRWARDRGIKLTALTVDHGLREAAATEAARVAGWLDLHGIAHQTLRISCPRPGAGVQRAARAWRFAAFDAWCRDNDAGPILLAHTREDQAETLWLRIAADSGPDGLAAMRPHARVRGLEIARPLLSVPKRRLIATCRARGQAWIEDPSNRDLRYTRVQLRNMAPRLSDGGLNASVAARVTSAMTIARAAMDRQCATFLKRHGGVSPTGVAWFDNRPFKRLPCSFQHILLSRLTRAIGGAELPPRRARVERLAEVLRDGEDNCARTLAGCIVSRHRDGKVWVFREPEKTAASILLKSSRPSRWDNRFEVIGRAVGSDMLGALGDAGWRWLKRYHSEALITLGLDKLPHGARLSIPVIHELDGTVSVPHFVMGDGVRCGIPGLLVVGFCPDDQWIWPLIAPLDAG